MKEAYEASREAEDVRAKREQSTLEADVIVKAEIEKQKLELEAEAMAEQTRRKARGEADAIFAVKEAEARGLYEVLSKQAEGFDKLVKAAGQSDDAVKMLIADKLEELTRIQVEAIKNIKIDKVTVWDSAAGGKEGTSTANFISGMLKAVPPLNEVFRMSGMQLPEYLGKVSDTEKSEAASSAPVPSVNAGKEDKTQEVSADKKTKKK